jgi:hypothetical protein
MSIFETDKLFASSASFITSLKTNCILENELAIHIRKITFIIWLSAIISVTQRPPIPGALISSSACCPSECRCVDKIPSQIFFSTQNGCSCSISKITDTPRPRDVISNPVECTSEPITKRFYTFPF